MSARFAVMPFSTVRVLAFLQFLLHFHVISFPANLTSPDPHPLVVRLPCHPSHKFDLECIEPWLKLQATCPLDRKQLVKKKPVVPPEQIEKEAEEDGEWDDMYA